MNETRDDDPDTLELKTVTQNGEWGPEAFRDAGEATFGSRTEEDD